MKVTLVAVVAASAASGAQGADWSVLTFFKDTLNSLLGQEQQAEHQFSTTPNFHDSIPPVVDYSQPNLPNVRVGHRVIDLVHGGLFDDLLQDTPVAIRPPSVIMFYNSSKASSVKAMKKNKWDFLAENELPARERLLIARYDLYSAPRRSWYKFIPELDLAARFHVDKETDDVKVVFVPRKCDGFIDFCSQGPSPENPAVEVMGCENFNDHCSDTEIWDGLSDLKAWIMARVRREGEPQISPFLRTYKEQGEWLKRRDHTSVDNTLRNLYLAPAFPAFSHTLGFKALPIPEPMLKWLLEFYERNQPRTEYWDSESTQMSFTEVPTQFIDLDKERHVKEEMANKYLKPLIEEWAGVPVTLTSFYGERIYPDGSFLKNHVDRIDTHVLSVTLSIKKLNETKASENPWPLEVIDWKGRHVRYEHPAGTMVLYESAKLAHGRPYRNRGGGHLGAFCHFSPIKEANDWDKVARKARGNKDAHVTWATYRSTKTVEPENPVFSEKSYGEGTKWKHISPSQDGKEDNADELGVFRATFMNKGDKAVDVYWVSSDGSLVHQGRLGVKSSFEIGTYAGHQFVFADINSKKPLSGGRVTIDLGRSVYAFP